MSKCPSFTPNSTITIQSETGADSTIVHAANNHIFNITADYVNITGFTIEEASKKCGILISGATNCNISNNIVSGNYQGIFLSKSSRNTICYNSVLANKNYGIILTGSSTYNKIIMNNASNSLKESGIYLSKSYNNEIRNNIANSNKDKGIELLSSNENIIANNTAKNNGNRGIYLKNSNNNEIYINNFINNANNAYSNESSNVWNSPSEITYRYNSSTYADNMGNYWGDYTGTDGNGDGLGDSPYSIDTDKDEHPLMVPWENYLTALFRT
ncbi:MAG: NosD domain-containing protein [Halobacteriota archaeon]